MDNTQKLHVADPPVGWGTTTIKTENKKRTAIHHNTIHPWFIIQAQVSVIQHSEEPPSFCQAQGQTVSENTVLWIWHQWQPESLHKHKEVYKSQIIICFHVIWNLYDDIWIVLRQ